MRDQHITPHSGKWRVRRTGAARASGIFATFDEAVTHARKLAMGEAANIYIHGQDGRVKERQVFSRQQPDQRA